MKKVLSGVAVLGLLAACQPRPEDLPRLIDVPAMQESSLGQVLTVQAQVQGWRAGEVADAYLHAKVGQVSAEGRMTLQTQTAPTGLQDPVTALLLVQPDETCNYDKVDVSDQQARVALFQLVQLRRPPGGTVAFQPLTSPVNVPAVSRADGQSWNDKEKAESGYAGRSIQLVYADRDVLVKGQRSCRRAWGSWTGRQSAAIHVQLRQGWNEVLWDSATRYRHTYNAAGQEVKSVSETDFTVRGKAPQEDLPWKRNADPLF